LLFTVVGWWLQAFDVPVKHCNHFDLPDKWGAKVGIVKLNRKFEAKQVFQPGASIKNGTNMEEMIGPYHSFRQIIIMRHIFIAPH
jgi:hypothetical protein